MIQATNNDRALIVRILFNSFQSNKSVNYIIKNDSKKLNRIRSLMDYSFDVCLMFGEVWLADDRKACALILHPQQKRTTIASIWLDLRLIFSAIGVGRIKKALDREAAIKAKQPSTPMAYLWFIGVDPIYQAEGVGSKLLQEIVAHTDKKGFPVFLETSTVENLPWYKKFGFEIYDTLDLSYKLYFLKRQNLL